MDLQVYKTKLQQFLFHLIKITWGCWRWNVWVESPALPMSSCVNLGMSFHCIKASLLVKWGGNCTSFINQINICEVVSAQHRIALNILAILVIILSTSESLSCLSLSLCPTPPPQYCLQARCLHLGTSSAVTWAGEKIDFLARLFIEIKRPSKEEGREGVWDWT